MIPLFIEALRQAERPTVHGDGGQSRAFTYIADVVAANLAVATAPSDKCQGQVYNIASDRSWSLLELLAVFVEILGVDQKQRHTATRAGDIRDSSADIAEARRALHYSPVVGLEEGLRRSISWFDSRHPET